MFAFLPLAAILSTVPFVAAVPTNRTYIIQNKCPQAIEIFITGFFQNSLAAGATQTHKTLADSNDYIYTSANGGDLDAGTMTSVGIRGDNQQYFIITDPKNFNIGVSVGVSVPAHDGFCVTKTCDSATCPGVFHSGETRNYPPKGPTAPAPPIYACDAAAYNYTITYCPSGKFPAEVGSGGAPIHPNGNPSKCLDVRGAAYKNGTPVQIYDCNGTGAQKWAIKKGNTQVKLAGTEFCLDAGSNPGSGVGMKIWKCYDNLPAQSWYYTDDKRIALFNKGQCLDLPNGKLTNSNQVQTWKCTNGNTNQIWTR